MRDFNSRATAITLYKLIIKSIFSVGGWEMSVCTSLFQEGG